MSLSKTYRLVLADGESTTKPPAQREGVPPGRSRAQPTLDARVISKALRATPGAPELIKTIPALAAPGGWTHVATFCVCLKLGTATYLDIWDADHFDYFTDMSRNLSECRVWFSAGGHEFWGEPTAHAGRVNCYFRAPTDGTYVCNAQLQSYGGAAQVECLIDSFNFGPLPFNGSINQPHTASLKAGYHSFRIRQLAGSFFFVSLTVWKV